MASAQVKGSSKIQTAKMIVTNGDIVEIIATVWADVRANPALIQKIGSTVAKMAQPKAIQRKTGGALKSPSLVAWITVYIEITDEV